MKLLESIKNIKADIRNRQLHPPSSAPQDSDASQDIAVVHKVQQMQREITEARSKKELVKGILRVSFLLLLLSALFSLDSRHTDPFPSFRWFDPEQGLILESGRDWTKDQSTRALMLSLDDEDAASEDAFSEEEEEEREGEGEAEEEDEEIEEDDDEGIEHLEDE